MSARAVEAAINELLRLRVDVERLTRERDDARRAALEEAADLAEADLCAQPGVIVASEERFDGGHSTAAAMRIAARIRALAAPAEPHATEHATQHVKTSLGRAEQGDPIRREEARVVRRAESGSPDGERQRSPAHDVTGRRDGHSDLCANCGHEREEHLVGRAAWRVCPGWAAKQSLPFISHGDEHPAREGLPYDAMGEHPPAHSPTPWRLGRKVARNVYGANDEPLTMFSQAEDASLCVRAVAEWHDQHAKGGRWLTAEQAEDVRAFLRNAGHVRCSWTSRHECSCGLVEATAALAILAPTKEQP